MTDYMTANTINDLFRSLFALLDKAAYILLGGMYEILFNVASADIFANDTVQKFYGRVQMIIGVFMLFKLGVSIIQGIINPDTFTDKKSGFSSIISRVIFALIMLTVLTPINIPGARSSYEINLNNNGLLFGTLYELQDRILENNTLGRLILGTNDGTGSSGSGGTNTALTQAEKLKKSANMFTSTILKGFIRINMKESGGMDETNPDDRVCDFIEQDVLDAYADLEASPNQILSLVNASCEYQGNDGFFDTMAAFFTRLFTGDRYVFAYLPIVSTIVAAIFIYILLGEIITIAIRSVKLAVLRLLAPIPIISYIDPKSEKDGAFGAWTKALTSTYLELFIHLAVIYFVIFLIQDMIVNGIVINTGTGLVGVLSCIFIWIGLFFFVKQAPKFIKDILGIKGAGSNVGLAGLLGGTAMLAGGGGLKGFAYGAMQGTEAATQGYNQGKAVPLGAIWSQNSDTMAKIRTGDKDAHGGLAGYMQDRLNYETRERRANELGIGRNALAAAKYEQDTWDDRAAALQKQMEMAKMDYETSDAAGKAAARDRYEKLYDAYQNASSRAGKAAKVVKTMEEQRSVLGTTPRVIDIRQETYRSARKVHTTSTDTTYTYDAGDAGPIEVQYRGVALDEAGNPILDAQTPPDASIDSAHRNPTTTGQHYTYESDTKEGYTGLTDDAYPWAGGGPGGPPPRP